MIAAEIYDEIQLSNFLNQEKVIAYAPVPILHSNKYEHSGLGEGQTDSRFKRTHTFLPHFFSSALMQDKDNGTDALFDFASLQQKDYCVGECISYEGSYKNFISSGDPTLGHEGFYTYANRVLDNTVSVASNRFGNVSQELIPTGQSLWYQVMNPEGKGVSLFAQLNWACLSSLLAETTQAALLIILNKVSSQLYWLISTINLIYRYKIGATGMVLDGTHYYSYRRKSGRNTSNDGQYANTSDYPQISFGINPIGCASGTDYGCYFGNNSDSISSNAPAGAIITTSDPDRYDGKIKLGVMHAMEDNNSTSASSKTYQVSTFNQAIVHQKQFNGNSFVDAMPLNGNSSWRSNTTSSSNNWSGRISGIFQIDEADNDKSYPQILKSPITVSFDETNDRVEIAASNVTITKAEKVNDLSENGNNDWYRDGVNNNQSDLNLPSYSGNGFSLKFGDKESNSDEINFAKSAYITKKVFAAELKNENKSILDNSSITNQNSTDWGSTYHMGLN